MASAERDHDCASDPGSGPAVVDRWQEDASIHSLGIVRWRRIDLARSRTNSSTAPNAKIGSFYGATETQRAVGYFQIPDEIPVYGTDANRAVPLGRGTKDVQLLLLNKNRQLAGIGELGELYVRSPHLATGYIVDEKRTQEMFIINPFTMTRRTGCTEPVNSEDTCPMAMLNGRGETTAG